MKRDWSLIRQIMLGVEETGTLYAPEEPVKEHARLLFDAGWLDTVDFAVRLNFEEMIRVRLTWEGRDFVDLIRSDLIWEMVFRRVSEAGFESVPNRVLEALILDEMNERDKQAQIRSLK